MDSAPTRTFWRLVSLHICFTSMVLSPDVRVMECRDVQTDSIYMVLSILAPILFRYGVHWTMKHDASPISDGSVCLFLREIANTTDALTLESLSLPHVADCIRQELNCTVNLFKQRLITHNPIITGHVRGPPWCEERHGVTSATFLWSVTPPRLWPHLCR